MWENVAEVKNYCYLCTKICKKDKRMKKIALLGMCALFSAVASAQSSDPVIMKINGKAVTRSEFEYSYNKNNADGVLDKKSVKEYVPLYVDFKLKVAAAEEARIDTISSVAKELAGYKEQMLLPTLVDNAFIEREARKTYDQTAARFQGEDLLVASHILVMMRQDASAEDQVKAKALADSIYNELKAIPADKLAEAFGEMAKKHSQDPGSAPRGGKLGQFGKGMMIPDFENAAYALKKGEMSAPIQSTVGYHIIYMEDRHPFEPYEFHHESILQYLEKRGIKEASANAFIDSLAQKNGVERSVQVEELFQKMIASDEEQRNLSQEYYDGTLMYEICKNEVWDKAQKDTDGMAAYFNSHKKNYKWDEPRYSGMIIHAKEPGIIEGAKAMLKKQKVAEPEWAKAVVQQYNNDSVKVVRIERGLFKKGDNATIDCLGFGDKTKEVKPMADYPETGVYGAVIKKPRTYLDVKGQVTNDYQNEMEKNWLDGLRKKYRVEIYEDVVDTVNKH